MHRRAETFDYEKVIKQGHDLPLLRHLNVDRLINRPLGGLIVRAVKDTSITPNALTYMAFVATVVAAACFCIEGRPFVVAGALIQLIANFLDSADGMLARAKSLTTRFGATLDLMFDRIGDLLLYGSLIVAYYNATHDVRLSIAALVGLAIFNLQVSLYYLVEAYEAKTRTGMSGETRALIGWLIVVVTLVCRLEILMGMLVVVPVLNVLYRVWHFHRLERV